MNMEGQNNNMHGAPQGQTPPSTGENKNAIAVLCYLGILVIIPLLMAKDDQFVKYHVKQGLVLLIAFILINVVAIVPILGWLVAMVGWVVGIVLMVIGIVNVLGGKKKPLPIIGQFGDKFSI